MHHLLVFARHPELGRVKTRLAATIGPEAALEVYQALVQHTQQAANGLADVAKTVWFAEPASSPDVADVWHGFKQEVQPGGDLGQKMQVAFAAAFHQGATSAVIIGTDCPALTKGHLTDAFQALSTHDLVLGPAADGGYYLLGMKQLHSELFQNKAWSTADVLATTLADAAHLGLRVALLPVLRDIDTAEDLAAWRATEQ
ncbi:TIGR04282 family arsenosugar biosynthesis glycosyltransferase [Hymenobacter sp. GOD-10R]|uniref:TIGR04282 family arsenosugar biosynthesis glycosyltransferase n=1 Tax=Hymenobacter sp. GOD-10R TaxID=3093922 RepID=UPI002D781249|nr:TIGR04282 family arsenosugar biosynthesis glycosyltransferase [Hymenobacter sp. GOD-10R]WRQ26488.1 TIGR04282 family arsenosugar biosynthesis glycosyltransferase [Hymenobacter sp. GOD-10R]